MQTSFRTASLCLFLSTPLPAAWLAGCAGDPAISSDRQSFQCPNMDCGGNSPIVDGKRFGYLNEMAVIYNPEGFRVVGLSQGGIPYRLEVRTDRLVALDAVGGNVALEGRALEDSIIELRHKNGNNPETPYFLHITDVFHTRRFWIGNDAQYWTYRMEWSVSMNPGITREPICPEVPIDTFGSLNPQREAIFFEGDLYNRHTKEVTAIGAEASGWFNIACIGSAPAKLFATRHTTASSDRRHSSSRLVRQAMLKMYTADYCGTGRAFTLVGEELAWQNQLDWNGADFHTDDDLADDDNDYESIWTPTGAACLSTARLVEEIPPLELDDFLDEIADECATNDKVLEPCEDLDGFDTEWKEYGDFVSANP